MHLHWRLCHCLSLYSVLPVIFMLTFVSLSFEQRPPYQHRQRLDGRACNCSGRSEKCYFDQELWQRTGHGGHCIECRDNTDGPNCEQCKAHHYRRRDGRCAHCGCDRTGSYDQQCDHNGRCRCKPGVEGKKCNQCATNYHNFSPRGCSACNCYVPGLSKESPGCHSSTGECKCKEYADGLRCDRCKEGYFDLEEDNEFGCVQCFCYGHSRDCHGTRGYYQVIIDTSFKQDSESWTGQDYHNSVAPVYYDADLRVLQLRSTKKNSDTMYFLAPACYLGDQRASYNQYLSFELRVTCKKGRPSAEDVIIEGEGGLKISIPISGQGNPMPESRSSHKYKFRLHEHSKFGWNPRLRFHDFMRILANVTAIRIRGIYVTGGTAYLDNVQLDSARRLEATSSSVEATWIETCNCPTGHTGQSCEHCAPGFTRSPNGGTPYDRCVHCSCHGHGDSCNIETGRCVCKHNTIGERCERCAPGYYGNAMHGTPGDCRPCPCPNQGECVLLPGGEVTCRECEIGHTGPACDLCVDGYYGDPKGHFGPPRSCKRCECNDNIDLNAVGNCNSTTGDCLKCIYNTDGRHCEKCKPGHYGNPLVTPKRGCKPCNCYPPGTIQHDRRAPSCDPLTGQCRCRANVVGLSCDQCEEGYWNIGSSRGCERCNCHRMGSIGSTCDVKTGQCQCAPGVTGKRCDSCRPYYYGLSSTGCKPCNCDPSGSLSLQCDPTGQCQCRPNMQGLQCTQCRENRFPKGTMCLDCPACYTLVEEEIDEHKEKLTQLAELLDEIQNYSKVDDDFDFRLKLGDVKSVLSDLLLDAKHAAVKEEDLIDQLKDVKNRIREVQAKAGDIAIQTDKLRPDNEYAKKNITEAERVIEHLKEAVQAARDYLDIRGKKAVIDAIERSTKYGQQSERMSEIAKEARERADEHEETAEDVKVLSKDALNISTTAYNLARDTLDAQERLSGEVYALDKKLDDTEDMLHRTRELAKDAYKESNDTYDKSLDVYTECNSLIIPEVHERTLKDDAAHIIEEALRINREADEVEETHKDTLDDLNKKHRELQDLLDATVHQQQITDSLLADTDAALSKAQGAVQLGEDTLEEAKKTLGTLKEFDNLVQESKDEADDALKMIPGITKVIVEAEDKTKEAEDALGNAKRDAFKARDVAQQAQKTAEQASKNAGDVLEDAGQAKVLTDKLKLDGEDLAIRIGDTDSKMRELEKTGRNDDELARQVLENTGQAKGDALDASEKARVALGELEDIIRELDNLDAMDPLLLNDIEKKLLEAERKMRDSDLEAKTNHLNGIREQQAGWIKDYETEIEMLQKEVKNIAVIRSTLPDGCYKRVKLEPPL